MLLSVHDERDVPVVAMATCAAGRPQVATSASHLWVGAFGIGMMGNGAIAGLGAIAGPCAFVEPWVGAAIGLVAEYVMRDGARGAAGGPPWHQ